MKAKVLFITTLLFLQGQFLFSQCISIELSVTWEMGYDIFNKDSVVNIPKLKITYRNNCDTNYYFKKICESKDSLPQISCLHSSPSPLNRYATLKSFMKDYILDRHPNQNFRVKLNTGGLFYRNNMWIVVDSDIVDELKRLIAYCNLSELYSYIQLDNERKGLSKKSQKEPVKFHFEPEDMLPDNLLASVKDQFVFLKSSEEIVDTYNLIGFKLVEGCFTFFIKQNDIKNYVLSQEYSSEMKRFVDIELELPEIVGEYLRYTGAFNTNKVTVCFGER